MDRVTSSPLAAAAHDLSLWGLFMQADWVVKGVMVALILASIYVWAIVFEKLSALSRARREADALEDAFWSGGSLDELYRKQGDALRVPPIPSSSPAPRSGWSAPWPSPSSARWSGWKSG